LTDRGPNRHVHNPIIRGVLFLLISESLLFDVLELLGWTTVLSACFPLVEESRLRTHFGHE
jgi:hypothetical protein